MKKVLKPLALIALAVSLMPSCKDTNDDAPYVDPNKQIDNPVNGDDELPEGTFIKETLTGKLGVFKSVSNSEVSFDCGPSYTKISGYVNGSNVATDAYLVSEKVNLSGQDKVFYQFESIVAYEKGNADEHHQFLVSTEYTGDPTTTKWDVLPVTFEVNAGKPADWNKFVLTSKNLDSKYYVDGVVFAFHYVCGTSNATTFEFKNVTVKAGECQESITPDAPVEAGIGSQENPASVTEALAASVVSQTTEATASYVKGFIVGYVPSTNKVEESVFGTTGDIVESNMLLAASPDEKDYNKCLTIQLVSGSKIRTALNLKSNPTVLGKEVVLGGYIQKYFSVNGIKSPFYAAFVGGDVIQGTTSTLGFDGTDNTAKVVTSIDQSFLNSVQGDFSIYNKNLAKGLSFVWSATSNYGMKATATVGSTKYESEAWMISPSVDLSAYTTGVDYEFNMAAGNYGSNDKVLESVKFLVSKNYVAGTDPSTATWEELTLTNSKYGSSWDYYDEKFDLSSYKGEKNVHVAFKYISTADNAGTFEIKSLYLGAPKAAELPVSGFDGTDKTSSTVTSLNEAFTSDLGVFSIYDIAKMKSSDEHIWSATAKYGLNGKSVANFASESWLISPKVNLKDIVKPELKFALEYYKAASYEDATNMVKILISKNYAGGDPTKATWEDVEISLTDADKTSILTKFVDVVVDLTSKYKDATITLAFKYTRTVDAYLTLEVKNLELKEGNVTSGDSGDSGEGGDSGDDVISGDGTESNPYSVMAVRGLAVSNSETYANTFAVGYIVGCADQNLDKTQIGVDSYTVATNFLIADSPNETDPSKVIVAKLSTTQQTTWALTTHKELVGTKVIIKGTVKKYFGIASFNPTSTITKVE